MSHKLISYSGLRVQFLGDLAQNCARELSASDPGTHGKSSRGTIRWLFKHVALHSNAIDFLKIVYGLSVELLTVDVVSKFWVIWRNIDP
jgi:hypothetical protein